MRTAEQAFLNGGEPEAISPINLLVCLEYEAFAPLPRVGRATFYIAIYLYLG